MAGPAYIAGAERLGGQSIGGAMSGGAPRVTEHTVEAPQGSGWFDSMASYLISVSSEPQVLYDPLSDRLGQFGPLTQSGRALKNAGTVRTNRTGTVNIQIENLGYARAPFTDGWDPSRKPNFQRLCAAIRAHGVPDTWPAGPPQAYPGDHDDRDMATWLNRPGWYGHSQVPGNDHGDPGAIDTSKVPWRGDSPITEEDDMTPAQAQQLTELHDALVPYQGWGYQENGSGPDAWALLQRAADPTTELGYKYQGDVEAAKAAGRPAPPDVYGMIGETRARVDALDAKLDAILAALKAGK
ncbi:hypothetical protein [Embleya sp. NPDC005971]|uniref:hypothetical protein n=1 Tax=Embleya sp. NPDC005971 TaxID=3156724 RepID=UPI0033FECF41